MIANKLPTISYKGTFSYLDAGGEQTVIEVLNAAGNLLKLDSGWLDLVNMTQNGTVKAYYKIDGTNYRVFNVSPWYTTDDDGFLFEIHPMISSSIKITYTEAVDEGAARNIPYELNFEVWK